MQHQRFRRLVDEARGPGDGVEIPVDGVRELDRQVQERVDQVDGERLRFRVVLDVRRRQPGEGSDD